MNKFQELGLDADIVEAIVLMGYETPSPVQELVIPPLISEPRDIVALAQTGTGKTAAFSLPMIQLLGQPTGKTRALILSPTRELCVQIHENIEKYLPKSRRFKSVAVYGGASIVNQMREIRQGVDIIVATPGRLMDLMNRKVIKLDMIEIIVLDEADEMLNMGFREDIETILADTPTEKLVWLFSATFSSDIRKISKLYMKEPLELSAGRANAANENITHQYAVVDERNRFEALKRIVDNTPDIFGLIFCRTKADTQEIAERMIRDGYVADSLHGDLSQQQRDRVMARFRSKTLKMLVATDVAARGIDVDEITHVIHYNLPDDMEYYTHRAGRTARKGNLGTSITIASPRDLGKITSLERILKTRFIKIPIPTGIEVCEQQLLTLIKKVESVEIQEEQIAPFWDKVYEPFAQMSKEEIVKRFASIEFNRFLEYYAGSQDLNRKDRNERDSRGGGDSFNNRNRESRGPRGRESEGSTRGHSEAVFFNIGRKDRYDIGKMVGLLCNKGNVENRNLGKIEMKDEYTIVEVDHKYVSSLLGKFAGMKIDGKLIEARLSESAVQRDVTPSRKHRSAVEFKSNRESKFKSRKPPFRY